MPSPETVAVIDVGSNTIKLLIAKSGSTAGSVETIFAETIETRISAGISQALPSRREDARTSGWKTITELARLAQGYHPKAIRIVATSAVKRRPSERRRLTTAQTTNARLRTGTT